MAQDHVSIDIEALGLTYGAVVASIGAVRFDPFAGIQTADYFQKAECTLDINIDIDDAIKQGLSVDGDTLKWWFMQEEKAQRAAFLRTPMDHTARACQLLTDFLIVNSAKHFGTGTNDKIWCNGANYDNILLEGMYHKVGHPVPWKFYNVRCLRTIKAAFPTVAHMVPVNPLKHSALHDAIYQAQTLQAIVQQNPRITL